MINKWSNLIASLPDSKVNVFGLELIRNHLMSGHPQQKRLHRERVLVFVATVHTPLKWGWDWITIKNASGRQPVGRPFNTNRIMHNICQYWLAAPSHFAVDPMRDKSDTCYELSFNFHKSGTAPCSSNLGTGARNFWHM